MACALALVVWLMPVLDSGPWSPDVQHAHLDVLAPGYAFPPTMIGLSLWSLTPRAILAESSSESDSESEEDTSELEAIDSIPLALSLLIFVRNGLSADDPDGSLAASPSQLRSPLLRC